MSNDRLRIPQDAEYFQAVGLAAVAFARLEWDSVWCCERLEPGFINTIESQKKSAGIIANDLKKLFSRVSDASFKSRIAPFADEFEAIVRERNGLMHGKPGTAANGDQRLFRHSLEWSIEAVHEFSDRCVRAGMPLNALLYDELKEPCSEMLNPER
jgi:hypothetical protein